MNTNESTSACPKCGAPVPADAPQGLCPKCVLAQAVAPESAPTATTNIPSLERLAVAFPQLQVIELIGRGGMGFVFKARQPHLDRFVALKLLPDSLAHDPQFAERFNREGRTLARLNHPNIVSIFDFGQAGGFYFLLMEYVDGVNLRQAMQAGKFSPSEALSIVPKICEALQYAHEEGILHRDIKPENILLDAKGRVKIADFGIAKIVGEEKPEASLTATGAALGTPHYMAPEQFEKPATVDHRADIYSLGVVFYEMLTGELPIGRFSPPSQRTPLDPRVDDVVMRTLEKEREKRFQSAGEMQTSVEHLTEVGAGSFHATARHSGFDNSTRAWSIFACCALVLLASFLSWAELPAAGVSIGGGLHVRPFDSELMKALAVHMHRVTAWNGFVEIGGLKFFNWLVVAMAAAFGFVAWLRLACHRRIPLVWERLMLGYALLHLAGFLYLVLTLTGTAGLGAWLTFGAFVGLLILSLSRQTQRQEHDAEKPVNRTDLAPDIAWGRLAAFACISAMGALIWWAVKSDEVSQRSGWTSYQGLNQNGPPPIQQTALTLTNRPDLAVADTNTTPQLDTRSIASMLQFRLVAEDSDTNSPVDLLMESPGKGKPRPFRVLREVLMDGTAVARAGIPLETNGYSTIGIELTAEGARRFESITASRQLAIVSDGKVLSAPIIRGRIAGGELTISGGMTAVEVHKLVALLNRTSAERIFFPTVECSLPLRLGFPLGTICFDLDLGLFVTNRSFRPDQRNTREWLGSSGSDLVAIVATEQASIVEAFDLVSIEAPTNAWETMPPQDVAWNWALMRDRAKPESMLATAPDYTNTFLFRTREDGFGLLQILSSSNQESVVKIRYKLVVPSKSPEYLRAAARLEIMRKREQELLITYTDEHPLVVNVRRQIAELDKELSRLEKAP